MTSRDNPPYSRNPAPHEHPNLTQQDITKTDKKTKICKNLFPHNPTLLVPPQIINQPSSTLSPSPNPVLRTTRLYFNSNRISPEEQHQQKTRPVLKKASTLEFIKGKTLILFQIYVFFVSILIGVSSLPNSNFLFIYKYSLNIEPAKAQFFVSFACFPICLKPLYGIFLDYMNFHGVSKHKVFVIFCVGEALSNFMGSIIDPQTLLSNFQLNMILSFFFYSKIVVIDAFVVVIIRKFNKKVTCEKQK
jgi:hypothetical protein